MSGRVELSPSTWHQPWPPPINPARSSVLGHIADRIQACGDGRVRVAIDGRTAAGKTILGHELAWLLSEAGRVVLRASLDDFKRPWAEAHRYDRLSGEGYYRNAFDLDAIRRLLAEPAHPTGTGLVVLCSIDPITAAPHETPHTTAKRAATLHRERYGPQMSRPSITCVLAAAGPASSPRVVRSRRRRWISAIVVESDVRSSASTSGDAARAAATAPTETP